MAFASSVASRIRRSAKVGLNAMLGWLAVGMLRVIRATSRTGMADFAGHFMRRIGPRLKEHKIGRANLAAAYPEKSATEIEAILSEVWDNLGRVGAEFAHIDRLSVPLPEDSNPGDILYTPETFDRFQALRRDGKPALIFASHLANWELPALVASRHHLDATVLYRRPNIAAVSDAVVAIRKDSMGTLVPTGLDAPRPARTRAGGRRPCRHARRSALRQRRRRDVLRSSSAKPTLSSRGSRARSTVRSTARASCASRTDITFGSISPRRSARHETPTGASTWPGRCRS